jgi:hypothetical protein
MIQSEILRWSSIMEALMGVSPKAMISTYSYEQFEKSLSLPDASHPVDSAGRTGAPIPSWAIHRAKEWQSIGKLIFENTKFPSSSNGASVNVSSRKEELLDELKRSEEILFSLRDFRYVYIKTLDPGQVRQVNVFIRLAEGSVSYSLGTINLLLAETARKPLKRVKAYRDSVMLMKQYVETSLADEYRITRDGFSPWERYEENIRLLNYLFPAIAQASREIFVTSKPSYREQAQRYSNETSEIAQSAIYLIDKISSADYLPSSLSTFGLNEHSAEAKAIQRIREELPDDKWEVSYKPGDQVDIAEIRNRLKQRVR